LTAKPASTTAAALMIYSCGEAAPPSRLRRSVPRMSALPLCLLSFALEVQYSDFGTSFGGDVGLLLAQSNENCSSLRANVELPSP